MDKLPADQQAAIAKSSSDRLRQTLLSAGEEEATVSTMDRGALKETVAKQKLQGPAEPSSLERELAVRRPELEFELELRKLEKMERDKDRDRAAEIERFEREKAAEMEKMRLEMEHEFKMKQLEMSRVGSDDGEEVIEGEAGEDGERPVRVCAPRWEETLAGRTKRFGDTLRHVLPEMPTDVGQIPQYFENVEHLFDIYEVPADLRSKLLIPHLSQQAKSLIGRLEVKALDNYDEMKRFLLGEFKLTAMEYKKRFDTASKHLEETHVLFASRLRNELRYYLSSRGVDNFEKLCNLLVSDKLKSCLAPGTVNYVLSLEGEGCFQPDQVARLSDTYVNCHIGATAGNCGQFSPQRRGGYEYPPPRSFEECGEGEMERRPGNATAVSPRKGGRSTPDVDPSQVAKRCWRCNATDHLARDCLQDGESRPPTQSADPNRFVRRCWSCQSANRMARDCPQGRESRPPTRYSNRVQIAPVEGQTEGQLQTDIVCNRVLCDAESVVLEKQCDNACWEFGNFPEVNYCKHVPQCSTKPPPVLKVSQLQYVNVTVNGNKAVALCDSGSQIPVVSSRLLDVGDDEKTGTVNLQGVVGDAVSVPLMNASVKLRGDEQCEQVMEELQLLCAVVDLHSSSHDIILPVNVVDELRNIPTVEVVRMPVSVSHDVTLQVEAGDVADVAVADSTVQSNGDDDICDADRLGLSDGVCSDDEVIAEQHSDAGLADCWQQTKVSKGGFVISRGVLYHEDEVKGLPAGQLYEPESKSVQSLKLAHSSAADYHPLVYETPDRGQLSFCWHGVCQSMHSCVRSRTSWRLRFRPTKGDPCATSRWWMLIGRRHVPDKLDPTSPITTMFVFVATRPREMTLTICWQLLMPMNCDFGASPVAACFSGRPGLFTGPCTVSGRRPSSSRGGCGRIAHRNCSRRTRGNRSGLIRPSVSPMARPIVVWPRGWRVFVACRNCRGSLMNCVGCVECGLSIVSRDDISPEYALSRGCCAVLSFVAQ